jgi:hypothetical protein
MTIVTNILIKSDKASAAVSPRCAMITTTVLARNPAKTVAQIAANCRAVSMRFNITQISPSYPLVALAYAKTRSALAKNFGLGHGSNEGD